MDVRYHFLYILITIFGATFLSGESNLMSDLEYRWMKKHLETDLTTKSFYKLEHILELTYLQIAPFYVHQEVESRSANNFNVLSALLWEPGIYIFMSIWPLTL